jgi:hypothetical protein
MIAGPLLIAWALIYGLAHWSFTQMLSLLIALVSVGWTVLALAMTASTYTRGALLPLDGVGLIIEVWVGWALPVWSAVYLWNRDQGVVTALIPSIALIYLLWCVITTYIGWIFLPGAAALVLASLLRTIAPSPRSQGVVE